MEDEPSLIAHSVADYVPKYSHHTTAQLRARVLAASCVIIDHGEYVSAMTLKQRGIRGTNKRLVAIRDELIAAGELPASCVRPFWHIRSNRRVKTVKMKAIQKAPDDWSEDWSC